MRASFNRAEFLRLTALSTGWLLTGGLGRAIGEPRTSQPTAAGDDLEARIARVIEEYDRQGIHRTATAVDDASAIWLAALATRAGATAALESFALDRVDVASASIAADGRRIEGLPLFDGTFTDAQGLTGSIGVAASNPVIALVKLNAAAVQSEGRSIAELRRSSAIRAIVAVTEGARQHAGRATRAARHRARRRGPQHSRRRRPIRVVAWQQPVLPQSGGSLAHVSGPAGDGAIRASGGGRRGNAGEGVS